jgi:hypothetical protein
MTKTEISHKTEAQQAEAHGHELGCFEVLAEQILEELAGRGVAYETGAFGEQIDGLTVLERIVQRITAEGFECECPAEQA